MLPKKFALNPFASTRDTSNSAMSVSGVVSIALHLGIIFGLSFSNGVTQSSASKDVADVINKIAQNNKKSDLLATQSQEGSGSLERAVRMQTDVFASSSDAENNVNADLEDAQKQQAQQATKQKYLKATISINRVNDDNSKKDEKEDQEQADDDYQRVMAQIATLQADFSRREQLLAKKQKVKTFTSAVDTQQSADARYIKKFRQKVESVGNTHYPQAAIEQGLFGDVRLMVILSSNGKVKAIRMLSSSESKLLDEYAKAVIRQAAPFGKFDPEMDTHELRLIRTLRFNHNYTMYDVTE